MHLWKWLGVPAALLLLLAVVRLGFFRSGPAPSHPRPSPAVAGTEVPITFRDLAREIGVVFRHEDGPTPMHYVPEIMGSGVAWLDYDQDGYLDLFLVQGGRFPPESCIHAPSGPKAPARIGSRLYRNQGDGTFLDVTEKVGLRHPDYGQGVAVGDYDNDGFPDLFVTCYGHGHLFHNEPDGRGGRHFRDVTREAGLMVDGWCTSCAFGDLHGKGFLDLFVCRYVVMDLDNYPYCGEKGVLRPQRSTCSPRDFPGSQSLLFRNNGDGTFTNISASAGLEREGKGLGVVILDLDGDGKADIFVGNDEMPNHYYRNQGNGKLESMGVVSGTAANAEGRVMGSMGVEAEDLTGQGRPDLLVTTYFHEGTTLFRNNGGNFFTDVSTASGLFAPTWDKVGWGTALFDADHDGHPDLFIANGHIYRNAADLTALPREGKPQTYAQPAQLFRGQGKGMFRDISAGAGGYFGKPHVGRGVAMGDYDNDGRMDLAVNHVGDAPSILHNETQSPYHWIRLQLEGSRHVNPNGSNRDAIGARVTVRAGGRTLVRHVKGGGSYYSAHERRLLIGLGTAERVDEIEVRWPNATAGTQRFGALAADRSYKLVEGEAEARPAHCPAVREVAGPR
jgi:hypothetical protein